MRQLSNSWNLFKASLKVLASDKELMVFPILSAIGTILITISFAFPFVLASGFDGVFANNIQPAGFLVAFLFYLLQYTVVFFANTALVGAASIRLNGGDPTIMDGIRIAWSRFGSILGYALIAATIGMILQALSKKGKGLARMLISMVGFAWNIATYLVVPVLAIEGIGPIAAIKRSVSLLRSTWGEQLAGNYGLGAIFTLVNIALLIVGIPAIILCVTNQLWIAAIIVAIILVTAFILLGLLNASLTGIYSAAVYYYAVNGKTSAFFDDQMIQNAFVQK